MNKAQAQFEKSIVPYRQKIRDLDLENQGLRIDKSILKTQNEVLVQKLKDKDQELEKMLSIMGMSKEDLQSLIKSSEHMSSLMGLVGSMARVY